MRNIKNISEQNVQKIIICIIAAAFAAAVWIGTELIAESGSTVFICSPMEKEHTLRSVALLCLPDILATVLLSLSGSEILSAVIVVAVFFVRGLSVGHTANYCIVNSVGGSAIGIIVSYVAVTLLLAAYTVYMHNEKTKPGFVAGILCYFAVSGAVIILRTVPYIFF